MLGLLLTGWHVPAKSRLQYIDAAVLTLLGALLGGRILFVMSNWVYYQAHIIESLQVWLGGFSGIGALVGGILAILVISRGWKLPFASLADTLLPLAGTLTIAAWMGCWLDSCAYGFPTNAWFAVPARDEWGIIANRVPVQLIGAVLSLLVVALMDWASRRLPIHGTSAGLGLFCLSAIIFALTYLRADPAPVWNGLRLDAWGALGLMAFSLTTVVVLLVFGRRKGK